MYVYVFDCIIFFESLKTSFMQYLSVACTTTCEQSLEAGWLWAWFRSSTRKKPPGRVDQNLARMELLAAALP
jgi:hypothetical protein